MARTTPPHLALALDRVKAFVSKHPNGVDVNDLLKVEAYTFLNKKARKQLLEVIEHYNQLVVIRTGKPGRESIWLRHKRYLTEHIEERNGDDTTEPLYTCAECLKEKPAGEFYGHKNKSFRCKECTDRLPAQIKTAPIQLSSDIKDKDKEVIVTKQNLSPLELRKKAEELLRQAEETERTITAKDVFQKQLEPVRREVLLAHTKVTKAVEAMVDGMAEFDKAVAKLREFKIIP
ncbi:hypothetical protein ACV2HE_18780 [Salmonella enterica subsp. enterica serovar Carrau]